MVNKYYAPKEKEFHIGFRYECGDMATKGKSTRWSKCEIEQAWEIDSLYEEMRVKHLDQEDIEELGWEVNEDVLSPYTGKPYLFKIRKPTPENSFDMYSHQYILEIHNPGMVHINGYRSGGFMGIIDEHFIDCTFKVKNYNELKTIMKQIGI